MNSPKLKILFQYHMLPQNHDKKYLTDLDQRSPDTVWKGRKLKSGVHGTASDSTSSFGPSEVLAVLDLWVPRCRPYSHPRTSNFVHCFRAWANIWKTNQESQDANKEFESPGRRGRRRSAEACLSDRPNSIPEFVVTHVSLSGLFRPVCIRIDLFVRVQGSQFWFFVR